MRILAVTTYPAWNDAVSSVFKVMDNNTTLDVPCKFNPLINTTVGDTVGLKEFVERMHIDTVICKHIDETERLGNIANVELGHDYADNFSDREVWVRHTFDDCNKYSLEYDNVILEESVLESSGKIGYATVDELKTAFLSCGSDMFINSGAYGTRITELFVPELIK